MVSYLLTMPLFWAMINDQAVASLENTDYYKMPDYPKSCTPATILVRMVDGLGFRYRWGTEGLREADYMFRPSPDSRSMKELLEHTLHLIRMIDYGLGGEKPGEEEDRPPQDTRALTLRQLWIIRRRLLNMSHTQLQGCRYHSDNYDRDFPIWNIINGPLCDALTHVGQITSWRRLGGNPVREADVFLGIPPRQA